MVTNDVFKMADQLARSLGDYKHQFAVIWLHPDIDDIKKLELLHLKIRQARIEIENFESHIFGSLS